MNICQWTTTCQRPAVSTRWHGILGTIPCCEPHIDPKTCQWFAKCRAHATTAREHATLGNVLCCDQHATWLLGNPTADVPPLIAYRLANLPKRVPSKRRSGPMA